MYKKITKIVIIHLTAIASLLLSSCDRFTSLREASELYNKGVTHYENSDFHLAIEPLTNSYNLRKKYLGPVNSDTLNTAQFLLTCLDSNGEDNKAYDLAKNYLFQIESLTGNDTYEYAEIETMLGTIQAELGDFESAINSLKHAKEIYVAKNGAKHKDSFFAMHNLNLVLSQAGYIDESIAMEEELLNYRRELIGNEHRDTIKSISNLAFALSKAGEHERAKILNEESYELRKKVFGPDHPETSIQLMNLAVCYSRLGRDTEAISMCREAYNFFLNYYPEGHPDIRWAALNLRNFLSHPDDQEEKDMLTEKFNLDSTNNLSK